MQEGLRALLPHVGQRHGARGSVCREVIRRRKDSSAAERVSAACALTKGVTASLRFMNPTACPMLSDTICSIYDSRPIVCRSQHP